MTPQTSDTNPLRIASVPLGHAGGLLRLTFAPGKQQRDGATAWHRRDLGTDLDAIAAWNAAAVGVVAGTSARLSFPFRGVV